MHTGAHRQTQTNTHNDMQTNHYAHTYKYTDEDSHSPTHVIYADNLTDILDADKTLCTDTHRHTQTHTDTDSHRPMQTDRQTNTHVYTDMCAII